MTATMKKPRVIYVPTLPKEAVPYGGLNYPEAKREGIPWPYPKRAIIVQKGLSKRKRREAIAHETAESRLLRRGMTHRKAAKIAAEVVRIKHGLKSKKIKTVQKIGYGLIGVNRQAAHRYHIHGKIGKQTIEVTRGQPRAVRRHTVQHEEIESYLMSRGEHYHPAHDIALLLEDI